MLPLLIGEFRAGADPELRFTPSGHAVCNFPIIANKAKKDDTAETGWVTTGETGWIRVNAWGALAERCANDVTKGCRVYVVGEYEQRKYETREGGEGTSIELTARAVEVIPERNSGQQSASQQRGGPQGQQQRGTPSGDPWGRPSQGAPDPWGSQGQTSYDEPPF